MKIVLYTQRVEIVESYGERRDCADQNIPRFLSRCGYLPIPMPNITGIAKDMVKQLKPVGIVLTGGNSLRDYGGNAPERDEMEREILTLALEEQIPVFGFCRGMQVILDYFGNKLKEVEGHVAVYHRLQGNYGEIEVNSFHNQACLDVANPLEAQAWTEDGVVESIRHKDKPILAVMWHPEREREFAEEDIRRVQELFGKDER